jgi:hypothetical protein
MLGGRPAVMLSPSAEREGTRMSMNGNRYDAIVVGARCAGSPAPWRA